MDIENVTDQQKEDIEFISKFKHKNERLSWKRKHDKMQEIIKRLEPLEEESLRIFAEKQKIVLEIQELRINMIKECVHPKEYLVHMGSHISCKFCNVNLSIPSETIADGT